MSMWTFYAGNISNILIRSGFKIKLPKDKNIIPIYFNPFIKKY